MSAPQTTAANAPQLSPAVPRGIPAQPVAAWQPCCPSHNSTGCPLPPLLFPSDNNTQHNQAAAAIPSPPPAAPGPQPSRRAAPWWTAQSPPCCTDGKGTAGRAEQSRNADAEGRQPQLLGNCTKTSGNKTEPQPPTNTTRVHLLATHPMIASTLLHVQQKSTRNTRAQTSGTSCSPQDRQHLGLHIRLAVLGLVVGQRHAAANWGGVGASWRWNSAMGMGGAGHLRWSEARRCTLGQ